MPCLLPRQVQGVTLRPKSKSSGSSLLSLHRAHNALSVDDASVPKGWKVQSQKLSDGDGPSLGVFRHHET